MAENEIAIVKPSLLGMFVVLIVSNLGFAAGLFLSCGLGGVSAALLTTGIVGSTILFLLSAIRGRPVVRITDRGFSTQNVFQSRAYRWSDIDGEFVVKRRLWMKLIAFRVTQEYKATGAKLPSPPFPGYDFAISGVFKLSMERLADLLNQQRHREQTDASSSV